MINRFNKSLVITSLIVSIVLGTTTMSFGKGFENFTTKNEYSDNVFKDIKDTDWFYKDVREAYELGLVSGKGNNTFNPKGKLTIAEVIIIAANINSQYTGDKIVNKNGEWYKGAVEYVREHNIIEDTEFLNYNDSATRFEVAYILSKSLPEKEFNSINNIKEIPDVDVSKEYNRGIYKLYNSGVIRGSGLEGKFKPNDDISRAEVASLVNRIVKPKNRIKFELGDILYKNDKYGFTLDIPRSWEGKYRVKESTLDGHKIVEFDYFKDGRYISFIFHIKFVPKNEYDYNDFEIYVGENKDYVLLSLHIGDPTEELLKPENIEMFNTMSKMVNEDYLKIIDSVKFYDLK